VVFFTKKTDSHGITIILLTVALNTIKPTNHLINRRPAYLFSISPVICVLTINRLQGLLKTIEKNWDLNIKSNTYVNLHEINLLKIHIYCCVINKQFINYPSISNILWLP